MQFLQNTFDHIGRIGFNFARIFSVGVILGCISANPAAANPGKDILFGLSGNTGGEGPSGQLLSINPVTGATTVIGGEIGFPAPALAREPLTGTLYAGEGAGEPNIYTVDATTGDATLVGDSGLGNAAISSLDFRSDGVLFAAVNIAGDGGTGADHLATIDTATGIATVIGPFGICTGVPSLPVDGSGSCDIEGIEGIAFDSDGVLWGVHSARGAAGSSGLYSINTSTGAATFIGQLIDGMSNPASGGFVSLQFGCDGTTYLGSARAIVEEGYEGEEETDGGTLATIGPGDLASLSFTFAANASTAGSSLSALAFEGDCEVIFPEDPDQPVTAAVQRVIKAGTFEQFSDCVIIEDVNRKKTKLDLRQKIKDSTSDGCKKVEEELKELEKDLPKPITSKLRKHQRAFEDPVDGLKKIVITLITFKNTDGEPDQGTAGVVVSQEEAGKRAVTEPTCVTALTGVSQSPSTVGINISRKEPSKDKGRNWTGGCNRPRSFGHFSDHLLAYPIRNDSAILKPKAQVNNEASDFRSAVGKELGAGCVDKSFLRTLKKNFNKAMSLVKKGKFTDGICALQEVTLFALDPDDNDPYRIGICPNDPAGHLPSRLLSLTYQVHRGLREPDGFVQYINDPRVLCELPPLPGETPPGCDPAPEPLPECR